MLNDTKQMSDAIIKAGSAPLFINIVSKRVRQLQRGARPLVEHTRGLTEVEIVTLEFLQNKIGYRPRGQ